MPDMVRDIMLRVFDSIREDEPVEHAIDKILKGRTHDTGYKNVSLMVVNEMRELVGVITLFDILYHLRPTFLNQGIDGSCISWDGILDPAIRELKEKRVGSIMSRGVFTASPDEHCMVVIDHMVKNKYRRLPVVENGKLIGIITITDIFHHLFTRHTVRETS